MTYLPPMNGGRINATISGNTLGVGALMSTGTLTLAGGNNITLSQNGNALTIAGAAGGGSNTFGMSNLGNSVGTSGVVSGSAVRFAFAGGNNVTLSQSLNASSGTITISAANQTVQTQNMHNMTLAGNTAGAMAQVSSGTLTLAGGNNITLSQNGNAITISGGAGGGGGGVALSNSQAMYTSGTVNLVEGGGAITIATSAGGQSYKFSVPQLSSLSATGAVSISTNGNTISVGAPAFSAGMSNIGNTAGVSGTASNQVVFAGGNNITLSQSTNAGGNTISISAGGGGANPVHSFYQNLVPQNSAQPYTTLAVAFRSMLVQPLSPVEGMGFPGDMTISTLMLQMSGSQTATSATSAWSSSFGSSVSVGMYLLVNSSQLTLVNSASTSWSAAANTQNSTNWAGARFLTFHSSQWSSAPVLSYGERYWYGILHNSSNFSNMGPSWLGQYVGASTQRSGTIGVSQVPNTSQGMVPFLGVYGTSLTSMPVSIGNSQVNKVNVSAGFAPAVILNATISAF